MLERFYNLKDISALVGKKIVGATGLFAQSKCVTFTCDDGTEYKIDHQQDDDEEVYVYMVTSSSAHSDTTANSEKSAIDVLKDGMITFASCVVDLEESGSVKVPGNDYGTDWVEYARSVTSYLICTKFGSVLIKWKGFTKSHMVSTMVDFVQTAGPGRWSSDVDE